MIRVAKSEIEEDVLTEIILEAGAEDIQSDQADEFRISRNVIPIIKIND